MLHERENQAQRDVKANGANADLAHLDFSPLNGDNGAKPAHSNGLPGRKRKHKVVIHSSPYLRCIQTSTGIAAGISQFQAPATSTVKAPQPKEKNAKELHGRSPLARSRTSPLQISTGQHIAPHETAADHHLEVFPSKPEKILLRIDAFLGEWLSPDYYEDITPPPNSTMMVAGAKADLLRRGEYIEVPQYAHHHQGHFPGGWTKGSGPSGATTQKNTHDATPPSPGSLVQASFYRERSNSQGSATSQAFRGNHRGPYPFSTAHKVPDHIYDPPVPSYAISPSDPIPRGYTAHARDACIDVDWQWDSMRAPQVWGDGGEYGDEWSTMHKRFRKGLAGMMTWYREHGASPKDNYPGFFLRPLALTTRKKSAPVPNADAVIEDDEDLVLVLVTHGAGCNALLGAISNQPILLDINLASLSMAVKRDEPRKTYSTPSIMRRPSVFDIGMSHDYEMKMIASIDHLRAGVDPSKPPQPPTPASASVSSPSLEYRRRFTKDKSIGSGDTDGPFSIGEPWKPVKPSSLGSIRRSSTSGSSSLYSSSNASSVSPSLGLWSGFGRKNSSPQEPQEGGKSPRASMVVNSRDDRPVTANSTISSDSTAPSPNSNPLAENGKANGDVATAISNLNLNDNVKKEEDDNIAPLRSETRPAAKQTSPGLWGKPKPKVSTHGLWGPPRLDELAERAPGLKRRWTVTETEFAET